MKPIIFFDLETKCAVQGCTEKDCDHALDFNRAAITVIGVMVDVGGEIVEQACIRDLGEFSALLERYPDAGICNHAVVSFDRKIARANGIDLMDRHVEDTQLMAIAYTHKIPQGWLDEYEEERKRLNRETKAGHREIGRFSLKGLHPHFCGGSAFWEKKEKDDDEYVMEDVRRARELYSYFLPRLKEEGTYTFYREKLLPWAEMLESAEWHGVSLDLEKVKEFEAAAQARALEAKQALDDLWAPAYNSYRLKQEKELEEHYQEKLQAALAKMKAPTAEKIEKKIQFYKRLQENARAKLEPFNINSDDQMMWLLREFKDYDVRTLDAIQRGFEKESKETHYFNRYRKKQVPIFSSGAEVLERLAAEGKEDAKALLDFREGDKLVTSFFPSYRKFAFNGKIHCNFNIGGTKRGRISGSRPNLQQQPGHVKPIFVASPGHLLMPKDFSGIEPVMIAYYSQDPVLCRLLIDGGNFHDFCVPIFFPYVTCPANEIKKRYPAERDATKEFDLSLLYGAGPKRIQISAMKRGYRWSLEECQEKYENLREAIRGVFEFKEEVLDPQLLRGEAITTLLGRKLRVAAPDVRMQGFNGAMQVSASDLGLHSAMKINREFNRRGISGGIRILVHDEIVPEADEQRRDEAESVILDCMTSYKLETPYGRLPLKVDGRVARHWSK